MDITTKINAYVASFDAALDLLVPPGAGSQQGLLRLHEAMRYTLQAGGKRLRPVLLIAASELFSKTASFARRDPHPAAVAIECIHTYSLIHDDLPCMDNDDLRRGRPTAHRAFDEATALLAGDALLTHAFALLAAHYAAEPGVALALIKTLAEAAGPDQLIAGQMADLWAEKHPPAHAAEAAADLEYIHLNKTAAMIRASLVMGGIVGGADDASLTSLAHAGRQLGLTFQIVDDILDATADQETLGKTPGKDAVAGKITYVRLHGIDTARRLARELTDSALEALRNLPGDTAFLIGLADSMVSRVR